MNPRSHSTHSSLILGVPMPARSYSSTAYRFGFQGQEKDDEIKGDGLSFDFGARLYDNRVGRWWSPDALEKKYPDVSPYNIALNNPIFYLDRSGNDKVVHYVILTDNGVAEFDVVTKGEVFAQVNSSYPDSYEMRFFEPRQNITLDLRSDIPKSENQTNYGNEYREEISSLDYISQNLNLLIESIDVQSGDGSVQLAGITFTTFSGGVDPSKMTTKDGDAPTMSIEDLLNLMNYGKKFKGGKMPSAPDPKDPESILKFVKNLQRLAKENLEPSEPKAEEAPTITKEKFRKYILQRSFPYDNPLGQDDTIYIDEN